MARCQMSITHGHFYIVVSQDFLQGKDIPAGHHKVCCKRMAQDVGKLSMRQHDRVFSITDKNWK